MTDSNAGSQLPRIEDFRSDLTPAQIAAAEATNTRAVAMQAYLYAFPAFLHMRQLTEFIQGRSYFAPDECPLGGWVLMGLAGLLLALLLPAPRAEPINSG